MVKDGKKLIIGLIIGCFLFSIPTYAANKVENKDVESVLLPQGVFYTMDRDAVARGRYIASSGLSITNKGYGVLGVYIDTLAHESVRKIKMTVYLDVWDEEKEAWVQVDSRSMTYEDPEGEDDLHAVSESFTVENLETEKYYRLRGLHAVWSFDGFMESHATMTDGVLLTSGPT